MDLLARYLPNYGWKSFVITAGDNPDLGHLHFLRTLKEFEKIWIWAKESKGWKSALSRIAYIVVMAYWGLSAYRHISQNHEKIHYDAIVTTTPPETAHIVGLLCSRFLGLPWVADIRDLWSQSHTHGSTKFMKWIKEKVELYILGHADELVTVSNGFSKELELLIRRKTTVITNGYDPDTIQPAGKTDDYFSILYSGTVYEGHQLPERLFSALRGCIDNLEISGDDLRVEIYGNISPAISKAAERSGLEDLVVQHGLIDRKELYSRLRSGQLLWVMGWEDANKKGIIPAKVFEYLMAQRPIILTGPYKGTDLEKILKLAGVSACSKEEISSELKKAYAEYKSNGSVPYKAKAYELAIYSYEALAESYAKLLDRVVFENNNLP